MDDGILVSPTVIFYIHFLATVAEENACFSYIYTHSLFFFYIFLLFSLFPCLFYFPGFGWDGRGWRIWLLKSSILHYFIVDYDDMACSRCFLSPISLFNSPTDFISFYLSLSLFFLDLAFDILLYVKWYMAETYIKEVAFLDEECRWWLRIYFPPKRKIICHGHPVRKESHNHPMKSNVFWVLFILSQSPVTSAFHPIQKPSLHSLPPPVNTKFISRKPLGPYTNPLL